MNTPWLFAGAPEPVGSGEVMTMEGTTFCISDGVGDIGTHEPAGLFVRDTRMLSSWRLRAAGFHLSPLRVHHESPDSVVVVLRALRSDAELIVVRRRAVGDGLSEELSFHNTGAQAVDLEVSIAIDADFADLFEVKEGSVASPSGRVLAVEGGLDVARERSGVEYGVTVTSLPAGRSVPGGIAWSATLDGHAAWAVELQVVPRLRGTVLVPHHRNGTAPHLAAPARRREEFRRRAPLLETADPRLAAVLAHSIEDLATLRVYDAARPDVAVVAAGAPWFMALFGRDSLLTSMMVIPIDPGLALGTLTTLGEYQGVRTDPETEEQPGKILHELRFGPAGTLALGGRGAYFGSVDATALFVMAVGELSRWHPDLVDQRLVHQTDQALEWMVTLGDADGDGFLEYARSTEQGLANQGWKDSWDGITYADGRVATAPIALAEVQGYAYAAYRARSEMAVRAGDTAAARVWRNRARTLAAAFDEAFWLPDRGWFALGLDADKQPIDALGSNMGHCLWTGIVGPERAAAVAARLTSPEMWTGWGIRTLASTMGAYNPMSYHNGSVWPHDTALCVAGLARYGFRDEARRVGAGLLDAAQHFGGRLPELFSGLPRTTVPVPVPYPAACLPQAWAAGAPFAVLRALLGLEPRDGTLVCDAHLPASFLPFRLGNVGLDGRFFDVHVDRSGHVVRPVANGTADG